MKKMKNFYVKNFLRNFPLLCSAGAFLLLTTSLFGFTKSALTGILFFILSFFINLNWRELFYRKSTIIFSLIACIPVSATSVFFYRAIMMSRKIAHVAEMTGCSKTILIGTLTGCCAILAVFFITVVLHCCFYYSALLEKPVNNRIFKWLDFIQITAICTMLAGIFWICFSERVWFDEAYSIDNIATPFLDVIARQIQDVHPPLYYFLLKCFVAPVSAIFPDSLSATIAAAKFCSVFPMILLGFICFFVLRTAHFVRWLVILSLFLPYFLHYSTEIRMYSWGTLFVTAAYFCVRKIMQNSADKKIWLVFVCLSLCCAYTHNFTLIAMGVLWGILFFWLLLFAKDRLLWFFAMAFIVALLYLPWFIVLLQQVGRVRESYWIPPVSLSTIYMYFVDFFPCSLLLFIPFVVLGSEKRKDFKALFSDYWGVLIPLIILSFGILVSWMMRPVFLFRYVVPCLPCFWIPMITACCKRNDVKRLIVTLIILFAVGTNFITVCKIEKVLAAQASYVAEFLALLNEKSCVITDVKGTHLSGEVTVYTGSDIYARKKDIIFPQITLWDETHTIDALLKKYETVYVLHGDSKQTANDDFIPLVVNDETWDTVFAGEYYFSAGKLNAFKITVKGNNSHE